MSHDITGILCAIEEGDRHASEQLLPLVYDELCKLATQRLAKEKPGQTLQATALVHEAYLRLVDASQVQTWENRGHFFAAAAEAMRRILIDQARRHRTEKHGGKHQQQQFDGMLSIAAPEGGPIEDVLALDEALKQLEAEEPVKARLVQLRYFAGVSVDDAAQMLGISPATAKRYWVYARAWLYGKLRVD